MTEGASPGAGSVPVLERPANLNRAFVLWLVIGGLTAVLIIGLVILAAAVNLRAGYRGARVLLTVLGAGSFLTPFVILGGMLAGGSFTAIALLPLVLSVLVITAVILMWQPEVSGYFRVLREELRRG
jgi:hypothetical protein